MNLSGADEAEKTIVPQGGGTPPAEVSTRRRSALEHLVPEALARLGWQRDPAVFDSALSAQDTLETLDDASMLLTGLGLASEVASMPPRVWKDGGDGAIVTLSGDDAVAIVRINGHEVMLSTPEHTSDDVRKVLKETGRVLFVHRCRDAGGDQTTRDLLMRRLRRGLRTGLVLSFFIHVFALLVPLFIMAVFDRVLGAGASRSLVPILSGAVISIGCVAILRLVRARYFAGQHARLSALASAAAEARLLSLPLRTVLTQSKESIEARLKSARRGADLFASSNTAAVFDAPFIVLSVVMVGFLGGVLVLVPALYLLSMLGVAFLTSKERPWGDPLSAQAARERAGMLHELGSKAPEIMESRLGSVWLGRLAEQAAHAARASYARGVRSASVTALGAVLGTGAALATLAVGVWLAIGGTISSGALVATMLLTWRITGPAQALFVGLPRLRSIRLALRELEDPLGRDAPGQAAAAFRRAPRTAPQVELQGAWVRYDAETEPALNNVTFNAAPGSVNAIVGANGAGKTTLLRLLAGSLPPQSGRVLLDGVTLRQYDPAELALVSQILPALPDRGSVGDSVPWEPSEADGWSPKASVDAVLAGAVGQDHSTSESAVQQSDDPVLVLLDDPTGCADAAERDAFLAFLGRARGRATVFFSTHDLSLIQSADNAIYLDEGFLRHFGPVRHDEGTTEGAA
ncbi:ATP-binding cassette domain-containing protein [Salipiger bermudensis]|uniref:ABC transporter, ATP-binding/permease protein n=1 Tax=Salipiger bermudensis (strain DSM 26914 / JCM 13377 / KCTC 12554 / HTCC2601) TaxID=314265 RepID=Q0FT76_SALBH|nr:ATP-binding cassette domain-containing protein [Salipiger bermudensis]EAU47293.1 ABC transporter, ATP-binding/permease protein [Salipiger bermudensis HTCC2601]